MSLEGGARAKAVLHTLADLSPSAEQRATAHAVPLEWFRWLPADAVRLFSPETVRVYPPSIFPAVLPPGSDERSVPVDRQFGERLAAVDQLRPGQRSLRAGWLFVAGSRVAAGGRRQRVFHPLVTVPVRVRRGVGWGAALVSAGDAEVTSLVADGEARRELEAQIEFGGGALQGVHEVSIPHALLARLGRLRQFARAAAHQAGFHATHVVAADQGPEALLRSDELVLVAGVGVYAVHETGGTSRAASLRTWASGPLNRWTAFHSLYFGPPEGVSSASQEESASQGEVAVESPYLLSPVQRRAVSQSRAEPLTAVSGAPGTGKSHTVAAIACDALARGQRVLVAAKSDATVDALLDLLERAPGPDPIVFGSNERREALAERLSAGQVGPSADSDLSTARQRLATAVDERDGVRSNIAKLLQAELLAEGEDDDLAAARRNAPNLFGAMATAPSTSELFERATSPGSGWLARRRRRRALVELRKVTGAARDVGIEDIKSAMALAGAAQVSSRLTTAGGLRIGAAWDRLLTADDEVRDHLGRWLALDSRSSERINWSSLRSVAALATALRSGRAARREQLRRLDDDQLTRALPLWVGTLSDIDDLLPALPALFDLVVLDEASSIDQPLAAPALLRAERAVVVGDPRQLRHVSFLSDQQICETTSCHGLGEDPVLAARLDVRRNSAFDLAVGVVPVVTLDEHFRSDPHLVDFVARRLYGAEVRVATRSPRTEAVDCIEVRRLDGRRDSRGVVEAEVTQVVSGLRSLLRKGITSVGVVTPFRPQADALEEAVLVAFSADDLEKLDLRVGTVHAFQGNERDVVLASVGVGHDDGPRSWRFVEDPHLFAVFVTRARKRLVVHYSRWVDRRGELIVEVHRRLAEDR